MTRATPVVRRCPLCGNADLLPLRVPGGPAMLECRDCVFCFALPYCSQFSDKCAFCKNPCSSPDSAAPHDDASPNRKLRLRVERARLARIERLAGSLKDRRVLEIGAGSGTLASLMLGAGAVYEGLEPTPRLYAESLRAFPEAAACVNNAFLEGVSGKNGPYGLVVAVDVLEYTALPQDMLLRISGLLEKGGRIYLEVPDEEFFGVRTRVRRALRLYRGAVHSGYVNFFSARSLRLSAVKAGLKILESGRLSLLGDRARLEATLKKPLPLWLKAASAAARFSRLDLTLGMGNLYLLCGK